MEKRNVELEQANKKPIISLSSVDEYGFCLGQNQVNEKGNEISAIPDLLNTLNIKGHIITTDAMEIKVVCMRM